MKQLICIGKQRLEWQETAAPLLGDARSAIVRPLTVATCDLDVAMLSGRAPVAMPFAFGHECVAEVTEIGADVNTVAPGDRVSLSFQFSCGECEPCKRELPYLAALQQEFGGLIQVNPTSVNNSGWRRAQACTAWPIRPEAPTNETRSGFTRLT